MILLVGDVVVHCFSSISAMYFVSFVSFQESLCRIYFLSLESRLTVTLLLGDMSLNISNILTFYLKL